MHVVPQIADDAYKGFYGNLYFFVFGMLRRHNDFFIDCIGSLVKEHKVKDTRRIHAMTFSFGFSQS